MSKGFVTNTYLDKFQPIFFESEYQNAEYIISNIPEGQFIFIMNISTDLNDSKYKQEIGLHLNGVSMGSNGDGYRLMSTFSGICKKGDKFTISSYKTGGNFTRFHSRLYLFRIN